MQGIDVFIPTAKKATYINKLLKVGFDTIDVGSFVSPKAIPQMRDTSELLSMLDLSSTDTHLLAIVANVRGVERACQFDEIDFLGYPLSLSETFQKRNTNRSIESAFNDLVQVQDILDGTSKELVVYLSMGFGNPYGDHYELDFVEEFTYKLDQMKVGVISLADTIGVASPETISVLFNHLIPRFPHIEFGAHLHTTLDTAFEKIEAVYRSGCRRIDGAVRGFGGCPMADDELVGNMPTEKISAWLVQNQAYINLNQALLKEAIHASLEVFG
ncbi:MAG: hydroxymethylglutaryl-CoA lyase [Bacteroidota bacterium]